MYRDWVIDALNSDLPYDDFLKRQLAGDELYPNDKSAEIATRFLLSGPDMPDINLQEERQHTVLNEMVSTVGEVILGLQVGCAQCHDHKYDAISLGDFYRLRAVFEPAVHLKKNKSHTVMHGVSACDKPSRIMLRGDFRTPGPTIESGVVRVANFGDNEFQPESTPHGTGRRTAFAQWVASASNPLTARVIANRVWQHHFGKALVETPSDFGVMGIVPEYDKLLDYLASSLTKNGWSQKSLHRLVVTSSTYRQRSFVSENATGLERDAWYKSLEHDRSNELFSRYPRWRLEGETIRDAMLQTAGVLNLKTGGPGVRPPLPKELTGTLLKNQWDVTPDRSEHTRRSIYVFARRNFRYPIFEVFDRPAANSSCPVRNVSTTAPQSLHLLNSQFSFETAQQFAKRIQSETADRNQQIEAAFELTFGRKPVESESTVINTFWQQHDSEADALTHLCLSLFNSNEFVVVD